MLLAINRRYWKSGKNPQMKVQGRLMQMGFIEIQQSFAKNNKVRYFSNRAVYYSSSLIVNKTKQKKWAKLKIIMYPWQKPEVNITNFPTEQWTSWMNIMSKRSTIKSVSFVSKDKFLWRRANFSRCIFIHEELAKQYFKIWRSLPNTITYRQLKNMKCHQNALTEGFSNEAYQETCTKKISWTCVALIYKCINKIAF